MIGRDRIGTLVLVAFSCDKRECHWYAISWYVINIDDKYKRSLSIMIGDISGTTDWIEIWTLVN
jgi:hypothetical protein